MMNKRRIFTTDEVVIHNSMDDIWVIINGNVLDLTNLFKKRVESDSVNDNLRLLLAYAGKDISWCFNSQNFPLFRVNQHGHAVPTFPPVNEKETPDSDYWWNDGGNIIGHVTCLERQVRVINTLTRKIIMMTVCDEDSMHVIKEKYMRMFNSNADNYIWRKTHSSDTLKSGHLYMDKTLTQNGVLYHENEKLGLPAAIWLFYNNS